MFMKPKMMEMPTHVGKDSTNLSHLLTGEYGKPPKQALRGATASSPGWNRCSPKRVHQTLE